MYLARNESLTKNRNDRIEKYINPALRETVIDRLAQNALLPPNFDRNNDDPI